MYLFPTKALAEDQLHEFQARVDAMGSDIRAFTYDGDTPQDARKAIRERANVVLTNPDMLHAGILPHHTKWAQGFREPALHRHRRAALLSRRVRQPSGQPAAAAESACASSMARSRNSSAARPPSPIRGTGRSADRTPLRAGRKQRRAARRKVLRLLQSAGGQPAARHPAQLSQRDAAHRAGIHRAQSADAGVRQQPPGHRDAGDLSEGRLRARPHSGERCAAIAAAICRGSAARSSASCATAKFARWWPPTRWSWASTSVRWTPW